MNKPLKDYRHLFFDLDNTVTRSRSEIEDSARNLFLELTNKGYSIIIVSGSRVEQSRKQTRDLPVYYLGQNGNHAFDNIKKKEIWKNVLSPEEKAEIMNHIKSIPRAWPVKDEADLVEDRDCQISYSLLGHNEDVAKKEAFDPDFRKRSEILEKFPLLSETVEVKMGGTTCLDYIEKGKNKGYNVTEFIKYMNWNKEDCVYLGDALFPGGNDATVIGIIDTLPVKDYRETYRLLREI